MRTRNSCVRELSSSAAGVTGDMHGAGRFLACAEWAHIPRSSSVGKNVCARRGFAYAEVRAREKSACAERLSSFPGFEVLRAQKCRRRRMLARAGSSRAQEFAGADHSRTQARFATFYRGPFSRTRTIRTCHFSACAGTSHSQNISVRSYWRLAAPCIRAYNSRARTSASANFPQAQKSGMCGWFVHQYRNLVIDTHVSTFEARFSTHSPLRPLYVPPFACSLHCRHDMSSVQIPVSFPPAAMPNSPSL